MSNRIISKVRKNPDFVAATRLLDELGIVWELRPPMSKGHPYLQIGTYRWPVATSPSPRTNTKHVRAALTAKLREWGLLDNAPPV